MSNAGKALSKAMDSADGWDFGEYRACHAPSKTAWWIANGGSYFDGDGSTPKCLGSIERHFLYWKLLRLVNKSVAQKLSGPAA